MRNGWRRYLDRRQLDSDKLQGVIRNPFAFHFPIQRGFSGTIQTLGSVLGD